MPPKPPFNGSRDGIKWWAAYTKLRTVLQYLEHTLDTECVRKRSTFLCNVGYTHMYTRMYIVQGNKQDKLTCRR